MAIGFKSPATSANINNNMASKTVDNTFAGNQTFNGSTNTFNNGLNTDTISEKTSGSGITIDGVLLKDGLTDGVDVSAHASATSAHGVSGAVLGTTDTQIFTNKTTDVLGLDGQASTPSNPAFGFYKFYAKDDGKAYLLNSSGTETQIGSGSGSGGINYITNYNAESGTTGWSVYKDTAATTPTDGTGQISSPAVTFVSSFNSTYALRGGYGFVLTKPASNCQGEGVSYDFTIDPADKAKMLRCTFDYKYAGTYTDDDLQIWVYDVTNAALIAVTPFKLKNHTMYSDQYAFEFQTAYNSTSYRLIFHVASTSTALYYFAFDNIQLGPQVARGYGSVVTDWKTDWTPTLTGFGSATSVSFKYRKSGDSLEVEGSFISGTSTATAAIITLPPGMTADGTKFTASRSILGEFQGVAGVALWQPSSGAVGWVFANSSNATDVNLAVTSSGTNLSPVNGSDIVSSGQAISLKFRVPIVGFSAQSQIISTDAPNGVVAATVQNQSGQTSPAGSYAKITGWDSPILDTMGLWNTTNQRFEIKTPGVYGIDLQLFGLSNGNSGTFVGYIFVNGNATHASSAYKPASQYCGVSSSITLSLKAGDYVEAYFGTPIGTAITISADPTLNSFSVRMLQGPSQILASADVSAKYNTSVGTTTVANNTNTFIDFETKEWDSHGAALGSGSGNSTTYTSTFRYIAPTPGEYQIDARFLLEQGTTWTAGAFLELKVFVDGSYKESLARGQQYGTDPGYVGISGGDSFKLLAGQAISIALHHNSNHTLTIYGNNGFNKFTIKRVGNY